MKANFFAILSVMLSTHLGVFSQDSQEKAFEGEIIYETYENYSKALLKTGFSVYFNGVHRMHLFVKDNKMHVYDETTGCHQLYDSDQPTLIHYCDYTKNGLDYSKTADQQLMLANKDIQYQNLQKYTYEPQNETQQVAGHTCTLYQGEVLRASTPNAKYDMKAYIANDLVAPAAYPYHVYGWDMKGIAMNWQLKGDLGHIPMFGEASIYIEGDVVEIIPKDISEEEFNIPSGYKIMNGKNPLAMMKYFKNINKSLRDLGLKGGDISTKTTGVHFKTEGEWDF